MKRAAIIVAGGSGSRMGTAVPKQFLPIGGKSILMHTLDAFHSFDNTLDLVVVLPAADQRTWKELCERHGYQVGHRVVSGGATRFQSVKNGLMTLSADTELVAIHDGVRPFVARGVIDESFKTAAVTGSAVAVIPLKDSIRRVGGEGGSQYQNREEFRLVQTPQTFQVKKILQAFASPEQSIFTDDATVYEHMGWQVTLIPGNAENIKITTPADLEYAGFLLHRSAL
ncbi:MAG: 2-C-methyl-D-erythritol 4-phosphate cytidylyltransferase [Alphaproteobacteria bacterium]|nr:2-C-methyl-D-erythritol 4-phosphate cytidylyltransferase [Alphaproteobacteria bacterium]